MIKFIFGLLAKFAICTIIAVIILIFILFIYALCKVSAESDEEMLEELMREEEINDNNKK